jgi:hypothetical protein
MRIVAPPPDPEATVTIVRDLKNQEYKVRREIR